MLFSDLEIMNCTYFTANNYFKRFIATSSSEDIRIYRLLLDSWNEQFDSVKNLSGDFYV